MCNLIIESSEQKTNERVWGRGMNERHYLLKIRIIEYKLILKKGLDINFRSVI
jgi:hypothetical protein